jgi:hypothetical protein
MKMAKDPVCGMEVDEKTAKITSNYRGKTCRPSAIMGHKRGH